MAVKRRYPDRAWDTQGIHDTLGVNTASYTFKDGDSSFHVFDHALWVVNAFDSHGDDQILVCQVFHIGIYFYARDMTQTGNFRCSFQHTVQKRPLLHMDTVHAFYK